jgi:hypothetical protein
MAAVAVSGAVLLASVAWPWLRPVGLAGDWHAPRLIPFTDVNPYGANFFLDREVLTPKKEQTVRMAARAGVGWARQQFRWDEIQPEPGVWRWDKYDQMVDIFTSHGIQVIARLDWSPAWVRPDFERGANNPPANIEDYGHFVRAVVERYRGRVRFYQIWNEPNLHTEWSLKPVNPEAYVDLLRTGFLAARAADPNAVIISAPLAINVEPATSYSMNDLVFLERMYGAGARDFFDILGANAFGMQHPPEDPPHRRRLNFRRLELQRAIMEQFGDGDKAVWLGEYAWNASPADLEAPLTWQRVTEEQQADYTVRGVHWARQRWPWAGVFNIWYFRQEGSKTPDQPEYYFRMVDADDWNPRLVYHAVRADTGSLRVAGSGVYEETNPALVADMGWQWLTDERASGRSALISTQAGASLTFIFSGAGLDLLTRVGPDAGAIEGQIDGRRLPVGAGYQPALSAPERARLDLRSPELRWGQRVPLVAGLTGGRPELTLRTHGPGAVLVDGFIVHPAAMSDMLWLPPALLLAASLAVLLYEVRRWR